MTLNKWFLTGMTAVAASVCLAAPVPTPEAQLSSAVRSGDVAQVKALLAKKANVNAAAADSSTPLHWAVETDNLEIANLLLAAGADAKGATRYKITPLALAAENGDAAMIERLLQAGADANGTSEEG